jgi:hypothetical protein
LSSVHFFLIDYNSAPQLHPSIRRHLHPYWNKNKANIILGISFNQPIFSPYASWIGNAITFATIGTVGQNPNGIFVNTNNTVYVANQANSRVQIWLTGSSIPTLNITNGVNYPYSIFAAINGDIYVDNGLENNRVDKWTSNGTTSNSVMYVTNACYDLFLDISNTLYCSLHNQNQVASKSLNTSSNMWIVAAGVGTACSEPASNTLNGPRGIFVDTYLNLYVADCGNNRVQLFASGQVTATTIVISETTGTISLSCPSDVALDGNGYIFIVDSNNHRILGSGPNGFRCIAGCSSSCSSSSSQLCNPSTFSFDTYGNIFVTDTNNNRIQKFILMPNTTYRKYLIKINRQNKTQKIMSLMDFLEIYSSHHIEI